MRDESVRKLLKTPKTGIIKDNMYRSKYYLNSEKE